ncbi:MAG: serine hydrolase domain-containing protein [Acidobacteriota bacterium]
MLIARWLIVVGLITGGVRGQDLGWMGARILEGEKAKLKIPGYAAGVYYKGEIQWSRVSGTADLKTGRMVEKDTPFRLASISKPLTAVGLLQMVEMKKLSLGEEVHKHCAGWPAKPFAVSLEQLLGHLGGVRHYRKEDPADQNNTIHFKSVGDGLKKFAGDPLEHEPGTKYLYTTYGYSLLGCAMEGASGISFEKWMKDRVFATVGMCNTGLDNNRGISMRRAQGYRRNAGGEVEDCALSDNSAKYPGGGMISTAEDLLRFAEGIYRQQLLKSELVEQMWTSGKLKTGKITGYGLGWSLGKGPEGDREVYHAGNQQGTSTILYLRPEHQFAFVWLTNLEAIENRLPVARQIFRIFTSRAGAAP